MRCKNIKFTAALPIEIDIPDKKTCVFPHFKDANNIVYEVEAIKQACETAKDLPIIRYKDDGSAETIGVAESICWNPTGFIEVNGVMWFGGSSEDVTLDSCNNVVHMSIQAIGIGD